MTDFTRLTVVASTRKAEIVVPSEESVGALIPQLMDLLDEPTRHGARPLTLVRATGEQLDLSLSSAQQLVRDGELLRLLRIEDAPPPPEVSDVTDVVAQALGDRPGLWSSIHRGAAGAIWVAALTTVAGALLAASLGVVAMPVLATTWMVILIAAVVLGLSRMRPANISVTAAAVGLSGPLGFEFARLAGAGWPNLLGVAEAASLAALVLAVGIGIGQRNRPALLGSLVALGGVLLPVLLMLAGIETSAAFGVMGVVAVAACGLVPWYALSASGLTGLDDQVVSGTRLARKRVLPTITAAYHTMTWTTVALAIPTAIAATVLLQTRNGWAIALGAVIVLVTALRTRAYPLAGQVIALWGAVLIPLVVGLVAQFAAQPAVGAAVAAGIAASAAVFAGARPARHHRARLRRAGNLIEGFAVVALLPLLLGVFNVYADLLGTF